MQSKKLNSVYISEDDLYQACMTKDENRVKYILLNFSIRDWVKDRKYRLNGNEQRFTFGDDIRDSLIKEYIKHEKEENIKLWQSYFLVLCSCGCLRMMKALLEKGIDPDLNYPIKEIRLEESIDSELKYHNGYDKVSPLMYCYSNYQQDPLLMIEAIKLLLKYGAKPVKKEYYPADIFELVHYFVEEYLESKPPIGYMTKSAAKNLFKT